MITNSRTTKLLPLFSDEWRCHSRAAILLIVFLQALLWLMITPTCYAWVEEADDAALKRGSDPVWYSSEKRALVPAKPISRNQIDASDRYNRLDSGNGVTRSYSWLTEFFEGLVNFIRDSWQIVLIVAVVAAIVLVVLFLVKIQRMVEAPSRSINNATTVATQQRKVTDLPFELDSPDIPLLQLIEQYRGRGDYSKAIVYLYSLILIELDAVGLIRLAKGKTNWTYLRELSPRQDEKAFATTIVYWFEHVFFGKQNMDAQAFESIWATFPQFNERLKEVRREHR
ncbi:MAG: hypothetical protein MUC83_05970 [Pirellula sp.]|jgi:hypothetical protein|nr:hypothetical protein [Pirellula sp.]